MPDQPTPEPTNYSPNDPGRVDTMNPVEVQYWCSQFQCSEGELRDAVDQVGNHVAALHEHFASHGAPRG
jgi:hypothetical protein